MSWAVPLYLFVKKKQDDYYSFFFLLFVPTVHLKFWYLVHPIHVHCFWLKNEIQI